LSSINRASGGHVWSAPQVSATLTASYEETKAKERFLSRIGLVLVIISAFSWATVSFLGTKIFSITSSVAANNSQFLVNVHMEGFVTSIALFIVPTLIFATGFFLWARYYHLDTLEPTRIYMFGVIFGFFASALLILFVVFVVVSNQNDTSPNFVSWVHSQTSSSLATTDSQIKNFYASENPTGSLKLETTNGKEWIVTDTNGKYTVDALAGGKN